MMLGLPHFGPQDKQIIQEVMEWFPQRVGQELVPNSRNTTEGNSGNTDVEEERLNRILERRRQRYDKIEQENAAKIEEHENRSLRRRLQERDPDITDLKKEQAEQKKEQAEQKEAIEANKQSLHSVHQVLQSLRTKLEK
jgi:chromosome segregation ATPase